MSDNIKCYDLICNELENYEVGSIKNDFDKLLKISPQVNDGEN